MRCRLAHGRWFPDELEDLHPISRAGMPPGELHARLDWPSYAGDITRERTGARRAFGLREGASLSTVGALAYLQEDHDRRPAMTGSIASHADRRRPGPSLNGRPLGLI